MTSVLSDNQRRLLTLLSGEASICNTFYLSGGTALAEFYLQHRLSEDIDLLQLGAQFVRAEVLKDYPSMLMPLDESVWQEFFIEEAKRLSSDILK